MIGLSNAGQKWADYWEGYHLSRTIRGALEELYYSKGAAGDEINGKIQAAYDLIEAARTYNGRTSTKPIDVDRLTGCMANLETRLEEDCCGLVPGRG